MCQLSWGYFIRSRHNPRKAGERTTEQDGWEQETETLPGEAACAACGWGGMFEGDYRPGRGVGLPVTVCPKCEGAACPKCERDGRGRRGAARAGRDPASRLQSSERGGQRDAGRLLLTTCASTSASRRAGTSTPPTGSSTTTSRRRRSSRPTTPASRSARPPSGAYPAQVAARARVGRRRLHQLDEAVRRLLRGARGARDLPAPRGLPQPRSRSAGDLRTGRTAEGEPMMDAGRRARPLPQGGREPHRQVPATASGSSVTAREAAAGPSRGARVSASTTSAASGSTAATCRTPSRSGATRRRSWRPCRTTRTTTTPSTRCTASATAGTTSSTTGRRSRTRRLRPTSRRRSRASTSASRATSAGTPSQMQTPSMPHALEGLNFVLFEIAPTVGGPQPAAVGAPQPGEPYSAQLLQRQSSLGLLAPSQQSKANVKCGWGQRPAAARPGAGRPSVSRSSAPASASEWKDQDVEAFVNCDVRPRPRRLLRAGVGDTVARPSSRTSSYREFMTDARRSWPWPSSGPTSSRSR
jgi:hypothetical protein